MAAASRPGLETALAALDRRLDVDAADDAVLAGVDGQLDHAHRPRHAVQRLAAAARAPRTPRTTARARRGRTGSGSRTPRRRRGAAAARPRTAVDLAVPFSPRMSTPPMAGLTALSSSACFMVSWPTREVKGSTPGAFGHPVHSRRAPRPPRRGPCASAAGLEPVVEGVARGDQQQVAAALQQHVPVARAAQLAAPDGGAVWARRCTCT